MRKLFYSPLFLLGLSIRLFLLPYPGSHYLQDLFIPFLDSAILNPGENPWSLLPAHYFPYGSLLFSLLFIPRFLVHLASGQTLVGGGPIAVTLAKIPLLGLEILLLVVPVKLARNRAKTILLY